MRCSCTVCLSACTRSSALETRAAAPTLSPHPASLHPAPQPLGPPTPPDAIVPQAGALAALPRPNALPAWRKYAQSFDAPPSAKTIAIILDDVGIDRKRAIEAIALPPAVTLAFLPYAHRVESLAALARQRGHETLVHMPMEPMDMDLDPGQGVLTAAMDPVTFEATLRKNLSALEGYIGINNHMGSRMTSDRAAMDRVMEALQARGLAFIDSRTTAQTVAADAARAHGLAWSQRDVFLDHVPGVQNVRDSLAALERIAKAKGSAVAIGHPKDDTLAALREWIPTLAEKDLALVPVTAVLKTSPTETLHTVGYSPLPPSAHQ
ncbi:MAG TPA: divergent polysaccharide deacetylase family protein [Alphaproteobacteria bacterium]|nr:divergent polysaccharide deacetylase family protein [Alphaproteobacteria bacterium]